MLSTLRSCVVDKQALNKFEVILDSVYREAVTTHSPGLSRFAATLGTELRNDRQPQRGCDSFPIRKHKVSRLVVAVHFPKCRRGKSFNQEGRHNPVGVATLCDSSPRVDAERVNPGLFALTASRYPASEPELDQSFLKSNSQLNPACATCVLTRRDFFEDAMHCPRCGTNATVGQQFCRSCGLNLEKVAEILGNEPAEPSSLVDARARLRERALKFEQWGGIAGLITFGLILLLMIIVVFSQMIMKGRAMVIPGLLLILLAIGAAVMGLFQTYSKSLKEKLANPPLPRANDLPSSDETRKLEAYREPVPTVTDRTTELLVPAKAAETGKFDD